MTANDAPPRAGRREWVGLAVLALPTLLLALDASVLYLALPHLSADLGTSSTQQLWITDIYGFMIAGFLVTMGTLGDRIGRRRLLLLGAGAFGLASVAAAYSSTPGMLIATRALLGVAGATLMPSTLALISNLFRDPKQQGKAIAVWISCFMGGAAIGPVVGGLLLESFWWGSAFLLGVPVMALLLVTAPVLLPEYRDGTQARGLDLASVALSLGTVLPVVYGLKELARGGWQLTAIAAVAAGAAVGVAFVRRQRTLTNPLLDLRLFSNRSFSAALGIYLLVGAVMGGSSLLVSLYLQMVEGLSPLRAGLWQVPTALAMIAASMLAPAVARRARPGTVIAAGLALAAAGFLLLTQVGSAGGPGLLVTGFAIVAVGVGVGMPLGTGLILASAPPEKAGSASAMSESSGELGIALGVAALGSLGAMVYRAGLSVPDGVPAEAAQAARESIAGAVAAAGRLPAASGIELLESAREAFVAALHTVAGVGAVLFAALAILAMALLRNLHPTGEAPLDTADAHDLGDAPVEALA